MARRWSHRGRVLGRPPAAAGSAGTRAPPSGAGEAVRQPSSMRQPHPGTRLRKTRNTSVAWERKARGTSVAWGEEGT